MERALRLFELTLREFSGRCRLKPQLLQSIQPSSNK